MFGMFDLFLWVEHLAHGPISNTDLDFGGRIFSVGFFAGLSIMIVGKLDAKVPRRALILFAGVIVATLSVIGLIVCIGGQL